MSDHKLPHTGGSYVRDEKGALTKTPAKTPGEAQKPAPETKPATAKSPAKKEA